MAGVSGSQPSPPALPAGQPIRALLLQSRRCSFWALAPKPSCVPSRLPAPGRGHSRFPSSRWPCWPGPAPWCSSSSGPRSAPRAKACCWASWSWSTPSLVLLVQHLLLLRQHFSSALRSHNCPFKSQAGPLGFFLPPWEVRQSLRWTQRRQGQGSLALSPSSPWPSLLGLHLRLCLLQLPGRERTKRTSLALTTLLSPAQPLTQDLICHLLPGFWAGTTGPGF